MIKFTTALIRDLSGLGVWNENSDPDATLVRDKLKTRNDNKTKKNYIYLINFIFGNMIKKKKNRAKANLQIKFSKSLISQYRLEGPIKKYMNFLIKHFP